MISDRLLSIASLIRDGEEIIDIGCDHGLLDVYLYLNKKCICHCCDVNKGIVDRAILNFKKYDILDNIDVFVGNGFDDLGLSDNVTIILSGMGTSTILKILEKNHTDNIICQTNTDLYDLRKSICGMGYYIDSEDLVFDNCRYYVSIKFSRGSSDYSFDEYLLGPCLIKEKSTLFYSYVKHIYDKNIKGYNLSNEFNNVNPQINLMIECLKKYI